MFLATTSDQRFWKTDEKILFLGEWCRVYNQKSIWSKLDHEVLTHPLRNPEKLGPFCEYTRSIYEQYLELLASQLNKIHKKNQPLRYWRILVGPWLEFFVSVIYERYISIQSVIDSGQEINTWLPYDEPGQWVPSTFHAFENWTQRDDYNLFLYGVLIKTLSKIPYEIKTVEPFARSNDAGISSSSHLQLKRALKFLLNNYSRCVPDCLNKIVFIASQLKPWHLIPLQLALGQLPYLFTPEVASVVSKEFPVDFGLRDKLQFPQGKNKFESLLKNLIPSQIPKVYVEGFSTINKKAMTIFPKAQKVIVSSGLRASNDAFRFWTAHQVETGVKLVGAQHGGGYGTAAWVPEEIHELKICDRYFSWGWEDDKQSHIVPMTAGKLIGLKKICKPDPKGKILIANISVSRYFYRLIYFAVGSSIPGYLEEQKQFVRTISPEARKLLLLRLYPTDYGWDEKERLADFDPDLPTYQGKKSLYDQLNESRLFIYFSNGTSYLETISANFPTILCWNPEHWKLRASAKPYFDELGRVGILHYTPESAAAKVDDIFQDTAAWWMSSEIQEVREKFCYRFARTSDNWLSEWKEEILKI